MWASAGGNLCMSVFRPEEHSLGARLLFKVLYTINRVMLIRQRLCLLLVAKLLLLAFFLWKAMFLCLVSLAPGSLPFCLTNADLPKMPIIVSPAELSLIFLPYSVLSANHMLFPRLSGASCWPCWNSSGKAAGLQQDLQLWL